MKSNWVRKKLRSGESSTGCFLGLGSPTVAELLAHAGFDWLMIETEHNAVDLGTMQQMLMAINTTKTVPLVRVPAADPVEIQRSLDIGAMGILVPMIRTAEEAREIIGWTRYPPLGRRGYGPLRASSYTHDSADYFAEANENILVILNIETAEAIDNINEIAAVPGVDALMMGPYDLCLSLGLNPLKQPHPELEVAIKRTLEAGQKHNIAVGEVYGTAEDLLRRRQEGFRLLAFTDYLLLSRAASLGLDTMNQ